MERKATIESVRRDMKKTESGEKSGIMQDEPGPVEIGAGSRVGVLIGERVEQ